MSDLDRFVAGVLIGAVIAVLLSSKPEDGSTPIPAEGTT